LINECLKIQVLTLVTVGAFTQVLGDVKIQPPPIHEEQALKFICPHIKGEYSTDLNNEISEV
jgi:hypothetical protein